MSFITDTSVKESAKLAEERGVFPNWEGSIWQERGIRIRNATTTTIAPTGSISIIAGCSSGIEPVFDFVTEQRRPIGEHQVVHPLYEEWASLNKGKPLPAYFVTAKEIPIEWHIKMQAVFQKYVHNAVSKTINLPDSAAKDDVAKAFLLAYELGCKGITVYRDGSRTEQVLSSVKPLMDSESRVSKLPSVLEARRVAIETPEGTVYFNISFHRERPIEVFITTPAETKFAEVYEAFARVFSVALRGGIPLSRLTHQLERANAKYGSVVSVPYALVRAFRFLGVNGEARCPDCGGELVAEEGCMKCRSCGFTRC
jgi:ribonucleoside-diphosphate reductase alpha chain